MVGSFRSTDGLAIRAMGVGSGCWLTDELGDSRWLGRQDQPHRFRPEQGSRHLLQVWADQQRHFGLGENVFLKIDSWRNFDHSQPIFGQLDDAAFGDVEDLLASLAAHLAGERNCATSGTNFAIGPSELIRSWPCSTSMSFLPAVK